MLTHCVEAAFMDFIQNNNTVLRQQRIRQDLPEQAAVCHVLHHCVLTQRHSHTSKLKNILNKYIHFCAGMDSSLPFTCDVQSSKRTW